MPSGLIPVHKLASLGGDYILSPLSERKINHQITVFYRRLPELSQLNHCSLVGVITACLFSNLFS